MDLATLSAQREKSLAEVKAAGGREDLEQIRIRYLGRKGIIPALMRCLKDVPQAQRSAVGREANAWRNQLQEALSARGKEPAGGGTGSGIDITLPGRWPRPGIAHPVSRVIEEVAQVFSRLGFSVADGPDIETAFHNFDALNTPPHHPSRDDRDTFWLDDGNLLRTQTSPVQIRVMQAHPPPVRVITPGRCYRRDTTDATHSANFHQIEGLYVDTRPVSLADLKATLAFFAQAVMGPEVGVRFRPHFFPFTEPSVEVDFSCHLCRRSGCRVCKGSGWIEIAGAGMVDPRVYAQVGYDPEQVYGYAFGMGIERIAMIRYGIPDIRYLYGNDIRFLEQFALRY